MTSLLCNSVFLGLNPNGLISLSPTYQNVKLVYPSRTNGSVCIVDLSKLDESEEPKELAVHQVTQK